jgi:hypothetical protein
MRIQDCFSCCKEKEKAPKIRRPIKAVMKSLMEENY